MRRVAPSVIAREQLQGLLGGGVDRERNIVSALVETVTRLVVQELLEANSRISLAAVAAMTAAAASRLGRVTVMSGAGCALRRGSLMWRCRRCVARRSRSGRR
jgi:hypothetical protein